MWGSYEKSEPNSEENSYLNQIFHIRIKYLDFQDFKLIEIRDVLVMNMVYRYKSSEKLIYANKFKEIQASLESQSVSVN